MLVLTRALPAPQDTLSPTPTPTSDPPPCGSDGNHCEDRFSPVQSGFIIFAFVVVLILATTESEWRKRLDEYYTAYRDKQVAERKVRGREKSPRAGVSRVSPADGGGGGGAQADHALVVGLAEEPPARDQSIGRFVERYDGGAGPATRHGAGGQTSDAEEAGTAVNVVV